ncbi:MAG: serpin family protein [Fibrobacterota bacterium]
MKTAGLVLVFLTLATAKDTMMDNRFAFTLYKNIAAGNAGNICISPYSISTVFAMLFPGSDTHTEEEFIDVFGFAPTQEFHQNLSDEIAHLTSTDDAKVLLANGLWPSIGYELSSEYVTLVQKIYNASPEALDYANKPQESVERINDWVKKHTAEKIPAIIDESAISPLTRLILTNAVYFNGKWQYPFDEEATHIANFYQNGDTTETDFMQLREDLHVAEVQGTQVTKLFYGEGDFSMLLLLPPRNRSLDTFEAELTGDEMAALEAELTTEKVQLYLPTWTMEESYEVSSILKQMGLETAFLEEADFSDLSPSSEDIFIDQVLHKTYMDVSEEGTEAAGATAITMRTTSVEASRPRTVRYDRPFVFIIKNESANRILFMGRVADFN